MEEAQMDEIISLCKRRGFVYPGSEIYGGLANSWDFGPLGVELKNNIKKLWWRRFVYLRDDMVGMDAAIILNSKVWEASGHIAHFTDPLIECKICHQRFRADQEDQIKEHEASHKGKQISWTESKQFNLMYKTFIGSSEDTANTAYLRPETAQAIFTNFKNVISSSRVKLPFGIAQIGKAFRNEITPGNYIFRVRELEQMEIEYFIPVPKSDKEWQEHFEYWRQEMREWMEKDLGLDSKKIYDHDIPDGERAHYSKKTIDFEYDFPFGRKELYGLAYRTDYDLRNHDQKSGKDMKYHDPETNEEFWPHVIEPSMGLDRSILAVLSSAYTKDNNRIYMRFKPRLAPCKAAIFPLLANKPDLVNQAKIIYHSLKEAIDGVVAFDDRGNIGKRYFAQDEIGTPFCVTIDFTTLEDNTVTVRDRDTTKQKRISKDHLLSYILEKLN